MSARQLPVRDGVGWRLLVVDADRDTVDYVLGKLQRYEREVAAAQVARTGAEAISLAREFRPNILLTAGTLAHVYAPGEERSSDERIIAGSPEEVADKLRGFASVGVRHLVVIPEPADLRGIERLGAVVDVLAAE